MKYILNSLTNKQAHSKVVMSLLFVHGTDQTYILNSSLLLPFMVKMVKDKSDFIVSPVNRIVMLNK